MDRREYIKAQIVNFCWREGGSLGGHDSMLAIAHVLRNRINAGWYGGDYLELIKHANEYAAHDVCNEGFPDIQEVNFRIFLRDINDIYDGVTKDELTSGALYYADLNKPVKEDFKTRIIQSTEHKRVAQVGASLYFWS